MPKVDIVVDANVVLHELEHLAIARRDPTARTALQELVASGTVTAYAPLALEAEVERHLGKIATRRRVEVERLRAAWVEYRATLRFFEPDPVTEEERLGAVDPDDLPYKALWAQLGARAVYTKDRHLRRMGAAVVRFEVFLSLRDYARAASVELTIRFGTGLAVAVGIGTITMLVQLARALARGVTRLPPGAQLGLVLVVGALLLHPKGRAVVRRGLRALPELLGDALEALGPVAAQVSEEFFASAKTAREALAAAQAHLPAPPKRRTVRMRARSVCIAAATPLTVAALEAYMRADGYVPTGPSARRYLLRVLRSDPRLEEVTPGKWVARRSLDVTS